MGFIDQFAVWQQVAGAIVIFGILSMALYWLLKRWKGPEQVVAGEVPTSDSASGSSSDAYAPMFRRIAPPTQPVHLPVTPETPRPGLSATTSPPSRTPTRPVAFTENAVSDGVPPPQPVPLAVPLSAPAMSRPTAPPGLASNPQRVVKIQPRTGAPIGDISAKPVTASIGTRLSVLSLSVVDKPYAKPQLNPAEPVSPIRPGRGRGGTPPPCAPPRRRGCFHARVRAKARSRWVAPTTPTLLVSARCRRGRFRAWTGRPAPPVPCPRSTPRPRVRRLRVSFRVSPVKATPFRALPRR